MCGICGVINRAGDPVDLPRVRSMLPELAGRGPDDEGVWGEPGLAFGHRRLAILDLSPRGHQPMVDETLGLAITFNGEIYNFREIKADLEAKGYTFRSDCDTEVLLKAYHAWGDDFLGRLNGMFAFCLYDRYHRRFLLVRDRLGIKPLYYVEKGGEVVFASNIQALHAAGMVDGRLSPEGLHHFLSFHGVVPPPHTVLADVRKLPPATMMVVDEGGLRTRPYWDVSFSRGDSMSEEEWSEAVLDALRESVRRRLVSDVPVGAFLSGGLDSSLIVGLMAALEPDSLRTYSIGFDAVGGEEGDEFRYSDVVAERFGTEHNRLTVDSPRLLERLGECVGAMAEPMVSHDAIGFFLLSEEVSRETKVVLTGQGADEVFAGYHWYPKVMSGNGDPVEAYRQAFFDRDHAEVMEALEREYHGEDVSLAFVRDHFARPGADEGVDRALRLDTTVMLVDDPVKRVDNMTMAWGLEARVPFLDHELVSLAAAVPPRLKVNGTGKYILKKAAERILPREVIYRKKGYFPVPALKYLQGETLEMARDVLYSPRAESRGVFRRSYLERLFASPEEHITVLGGSKLWQLTLLEMWLQRLGV